MNDQYEQHWHNGAKSPAKAPPGHERLAAHARATVEAEGAETWPEGLVCHLAQHLADRAADHYCDEKHWDDYREDATAALDAVRAWKGRE
jgi:hypothetical protein